MGLVLTIDFLCVALLLTVALTKGFERTLPLAAFLLLIFPYESLIRLPGLFDLTTQRIIIMELVVLYLAFGRTRSRGRLQKKLPLRNFIGLLVVWMFLSASMSVVPEVSFKAVLSQIFDYFIVYYIFSNAISKQDTVQDCIFGFVLGMFICSIIGFLNAYFDLDVLSVFPTVQHRFSYLMGGVNDRGYRVQSSFGHAILFGTTLALSIPLALYLLTVAKTHGRKVFLWLAIVMMFMNLYKTGSRGPWISAILSGLILLLLSRNQIRRYLLVIGMLSLTVLIVRPGVWQTIVNLYYETRNPETAQGASYEWRYALYRIAGRELSKDLGRALCGYGPESFYYLGLEGEFEGTTVKFESCDSEVVELLMDIGCVGFLIVAAILAKVAFSNFRNFRKLPCPANSLCMVLFVDMIIFIFMMTNVEIFWGQQTYMLWILMSLSMTYPGLVLAGPQREARATLSHQPASALTF